MYKLMHSIRADKIIFAVLERRLIKLLIKWLQFFVNNICGFINIFIVWCRIPNFRYHGNKCRSGVNFNNTVKLPQLENCVVCGQILNNISYVKKALRKIFETCNGIESETYDSRYFKLIGTLQYTPCLRKNCANLSFAPWLTNTNRFQSKLEELSRNKSLTKLCLKCPLHLKYVLALPWEIQRVRLSRQRNN